MNNNIFRVTVAAVLAMGTALGAHAASYWSVTMTGQIASGFDTSGIFGTVDQDLTGMSFSQTITVDTDPAKWTDHVSPNAYGPYVYVDGTGPIFTDTVTVGGHTASYVVTASYGEQFVSNGLSSGNGYYPYDAVYSYQNGSTADGNNVYSYQYVSSGSTTFVPNASFSQAFSQNLANGSFDSYSYFQLDGNQDVYFQGVPGTVSVSAVPESSLPAMLAAGLAALGLVSRRKAAKSA